MRPYYTTPLGRLYQGDCFTVLPQLEEQSVQFVVTSPPYFGLRDYGDPNQIGLEETPDCLGWVTGECCGKCYVCHLVQVFREVWRVLRDDGTVWLNLGDSYNSGGSSTQIVDSSIRESTRSDALTGGRIPPQGRPPRVKNLKPKDLIGIPWRVAFALQADGWYLRQDIIWSKPNPMPESVTDRCTKAHEYVFLLSKSERYYYDAEVIKESANWDGKSGTKNYRPTPDGRIGAGMNSGGATDKRNKRSVWTINTRPYPGAHFAVFPPDLVRPCIKAGGPKQGVVLDPFFGAGTTGLVAQELDRHWIGIELSEQYCELVKQRIPREHKQKLPLEAPCGT